MNKSACIFPTGNPLLQRVEFPGPEVCSSLKITALKSRNCLMWLKVKQNLKGNAL